jgi:SAM-dependent methyltransferase
MKIFQHLKKVFVATPPPDSSLSEKARHELAYWERRLAKEGVLQRGHYKHFYTAHFGLSLDFYRGKKILDIGCGPRGSLEWADGVALRAGVDTLASKYCRLGITRHAMRYVAASSERLPLRDGSFDIVCSFNSLDHVDDLEGTLREIPRVLAARGLFLLLTDIHGQPSVCEPSVFGWDIVKKFQPALTLIEEKHYERVPAGMYDSIHADTPFNHKNPRERYGVLSAKFLKRE